MHSSKQLISISQIYHIKRNNYILFNKIFMEFLIFLYKLYNFLGINLKNMGIYSITNFSISSIAGITQSAPLLVVISDAPAFLNKVVSPNNKDARFIRRPHCSKVLIFKCDININRYLICQ